MKTTTLALSLISSALLLACSDSSNYDFDGSRDAAVAAADDTGTLDFAPRYDPANGLLPFPDNLLFSGSTDGTLNIPVDDPNDYSDPRVAMNALDGFATSAPISVTLTQAADPATVALGSSVRVFEVTTDAATGAVTGISRELGPAELFASVAGDNDDAIAILPIVPLAPQTTYLVVLTNDITSATAPAAPMDKSVMYYLTSGETPLSGELADLEPLRQLTASYEAAASSAGISEDSITLSWTFTTQSVQPTLTALTGRRAPQTVQLAPGSINTQSLGNGFNGSADLHVGSIALPYYQRSPEDADGADVINGFFLTDAGGFTTVLDPAPAVRSTQTVPVLISIPAVGTAPAAGWPVAIFQHGITRSRADMLALADSMGQAGIALVAIDLPMHGIVDTGNLLHANSALMSTLDATERHFQLDLRDNDSGQAGSDGVTDASGAHFYNLGNLLNARDNLRQAVADLLNLRASLGAFSELGIDSETVSFVGQSLGAITGTVFLAQDEETGPAVLSVPGVGLAQLLANSATFGPVIESGLSDAGVSVDGPAYEQFLTAAQTVLDSGDPVNFASTAATLHPTLLHEVVGDSAGSLPDQVIPNAVLTAPLSGTEPQIRLMGLPGITTTQDGNGSAVNGAVRFVAGDHGSLLDPQTDPATTQEMQTQAAGFLASGGTRITVTNPDVVAGN